MSIATMILGASGSGKTTSLRNLDPTQTLLIQTINKPLPFDSRGWKRIGQNQPGSVYVSPEVGPVLRAMTQTKRPIIVIDDFQYLMAGELIRRSDEKGYDKFTDIAKHAWQVFEAAGNLLDYQRVYVMAHTQTDEFGQTKMKTVGRMIDEKIVPEGFFTIVLRTVAENGIYFFRTQTNGQDPCKSPIDMFDEQLIDNDLKTVDDRIAAFYDLIPGPAAKAA